MVLRSRTGCLGGGERVRRPASEDSTVGASVPRRVTGIRDVRHTAPRVPSSRAAGAKPSWRVARPERCAQRRLPRSPESVSGPLMGCGRRPSTHLAVDESSSPCGASRRAARRRTRRTQCFGGVRRRRPLGGAPPRGGGGACRSRRCAGKYSVGVVVSFFATEPKNTASAAPPWVVPAVESVESFEPPRETIWGRGTEAARAVAERGTLSCSWPGPSALVEGRATTHDVDSPLVER